MKTVVDQTAPTAGLAGSWNNCWIGRNPGHLEASHQTLGLRNKPAQMSWFACDIALVLPPQPVEKIANNPGIEHKARRKLYQEWSALFLQQSGLIQKPAEIALSLDQAALVRDFSGDLQRE